MQNIYTLILQKGQLKKLHAFQSQKEGSFLGHFFMHNSLGKPEECVWFQCPTDNIVIHYYMDQLINPYHHPHPIERQCVSSLRMLVIDLVTKAVVSFAGTNRWDMEAGKRWGLNNTSTQHLPPASPKRFSGEWICNVIVVVDKYRLCFIFFFLSKALINNHILDFF